MNALSRKYFDVSGLVDLHDKPRILWLRGDSDRVISDHSLFDIAAQTSPATNVLDQKTMPYQPMVRQLRHLLCRYEKVGGSCSEMVFTNTGHAPFLEKPEEFVSHYVEFLSRCDSGPNKRTGQIVAS